MVLNNYSKITDRRIPTLSDLSDVLQLLKHYAIMQEFSVSWEALHGNTRHIWFSPAYIARVWTSSKEQHLVEWLSANLHTRQRHYQRGPEVSTYFPLHFKYYHWKYSGHLFMKIGQVVVRLTLLTPQRLQPGAPDPPHRGDHLPLSQCLPLCFLFRSSQASPLSDLPVEHEWHEPSRHPHLSWVPGVALSKVEMLHFCWITDVSYQ